MKVHPLVARAAGSLIWAMFLVGLLRLVPVNQENRLNLYIWSAYVAPETLPAFEKRYGVKVNVDYYDANEAVLAKLQAGNVDYDLVVPSDYMVEILIRGGLLAELDKGSLRNLRNVAPEFLDLPFDPGNRYSLPYTWGTAAIGYRRDKVKGPIESWSALWDPLYRNRIIVLDDMRENFSAALKSLGYSCNTTDPRQIGEARDRLLAQKPLLRAYNSSNFQEMLLSGDAWLAQGFNGQIAKAMKDDERIAYVIPREGCTRNVDNLCIPKGAPHKQLAHQFIDYVLEAAVAASQCNHTYYSTPNQAALPFIAKHVKANHAVFPPSERLAACEYIRDLGAAVLLYDKAWTEIKSR